MPHDFPTERGRYRPPSFADPGSCSAFCPRLHTPLNTLHHPFSQNAPSLAHEPSSSTFEELPATPPNFPLGAAPRTLYVPDAMLLPSPLPPPSGTTCHLSLEFSRNPTEGPPMTFLFHMTPATSRQVSTEAPSNCDPQTTPQSFSPGHPGRPRAPGALPRLASASAGDFLPRAPLPSYLQPRAEAPSAGAAFWGGWPSGSGRERERMGKRMRHAVRPGTETVRASHAEARRDMDTGQGRGRREGLVVLGGWRGGTEQGSGPALMLPCVEEVGVVSHVPVTLWRPFIPGLGSWPCPLPPPPAPALLLTFFLIA